MDRLTEVDLPDGGKTTVTYNDSTFSAANNTPSFTTTTKIDNSGDNIVKTAAFDGMGHAVRTMLMSDVTTGTQTTDFIDTIYDGSGHVWKVTNPYRTTGDPTYGVTQNSYDAIGRVASIQEPDRPSIITNSYSGTCTTTTDETQKSRKSCSDALGRLQTVFEDPSAANYETDYGFDVLGNLLNVHQKGTAPSDSTRWRTRTFTYDSLSRLLTAINPESGAITYAYDANGNLTSKTDARPQTISYCYDDLSRQLGRQYASSISCTSSTNWNVQYTYDTGSSYPVGLRTGMADASGSATWAYDPMGRVTGLVKTIAGSQLPGNQPISKTVGYQYWLDGSVESITYPSSRVVQYHTNTAGWTDWVYKTNPGSGQTLRYAQVNSFAPTGKATEILLGSVQSCFSGALQEFNYNNRLQLANMLYTTNTNSQTAQQAVQSTSCISTGGDVMHRINSLQDPLHNYANNGNVFKITNCVDTNRSQNFDYDTLNRIAHAYTDGPNWGEQFTIDAWGNLTNIGPYNSKNVSELLNQPVNPATNQANGFGFDGAGNQLTSTDPWGVPHTFTYDAESRIAAVDTNGALYVYDGDGGRALKNVGGTGTIYWYGADDSILGESDLTGTVMAEYIFFDGRRIARTDNPTSSTEASLKYYLTDHLGSTSMIADATFSTMMEDTDYYPYGREVFLNSSDSNHYHFTGKERDSETGNDYFGARYYASSMGRFMSPDWASKPEAVPYSSLSDPQTLNLYGYMRNNPLGGTDKDGHCGQQQSGGTTCPNVTVTVKADADPHVMHNQQPNPDVAKVGTTTTVTVSSGGQPVAGAKVQESPSTTNNLTGTNSGNQANPNTLTTSSAGTIKDVVAQQVVAEPTSTAEIQDHVNATPYDRTTNQTLTITTPGAGGATCTCTATYSEHMSNVTNGQLNAPNASGTNYNLTISPVVVKPTPPQ